MMENVMFGVPQKKSYYNIFVHCFCITVQVQVWLCIKGLKI